MSRKNRWRKIGRIEMQRVSGRYTNGELRGDDILWARSTGRDASNHGKAITYCSTDLGAPHGPARLGLGVYLPINSKGDAIAIGKAMWRHLDDDMRRRGIL